MGGIGLKTRPRLGLGSLGLGPTRRYSLDMKPLLFALTVALLPAAAAAQPVPAKPAAAPAFDAKTKLLGEIEAWRGLHLPVVVPANPLTARYEPRLNDIKSRAEAAKGEADLAKPTQDFQDWKLILMREKYADAQSAGQAPASFALYSAEQIQQAAFSAALRAEIRQGAVEQAAYRASQQTLAPAARAPEGVFDGNSARGALDASAPNGAVAAPAPVDPKDPARYAKVRAILISQGARSKVVDAAIKEAIRQNADPLLVLAVIKQESHFNPNAHSGVGARGLMQIMPDTGRGLGVHNSSALYDVQTNLRAGIKYLKQLWNRFTDIDMTAIQSINPFADHDAKAAVAAYNAGPGAVHKYGGVPPYRETQGYVSKVLGYYSQMKASLGW